jgi:DNA-binding NarL/FixJ family response regulator
MAVAGARLGVSVVLADDHLVVRQGLRAVLSVQPDIEVVGEASNGPEALDVVQDLQPQVLVLDLMMPGLPGLEVIKYVPSRSPATNIVVLSMHSDETYVSQSLKNGARAYVVKSARGDALVTAIHHAAEGRRYLSPPLSADALERYEGGLEVEQPDPYETLSPRERQILRLAADGQSNMQIATQLGLSKRTVEVHLSRVKMKLRTPSRAEMLRYAIRRESPPTS